MNVLIIGLGSIAKKHIEAIYKIYATAKIYALRRSIQKNKNVEGVINVYELDDIEMDDIDFILISNPTSEHFFTIQNLVKYKKPLFIEKPLFSEINKDTSNLVEEVENKGVISYVACNLRFLESLQKLKKLIVGKFINEVNVYCGSYLPSWRADVDFRKVYSANKEMGGGVHIDLIHELDYVYWLFGNPQKTNSFFSNNSSLEISANDYANYLWIYEKFSASIILNYFRKDSKRSLEVVTDEGTYIVNLLQNSIMLNNNYIFESSQRIKDTYFDQMNFFLERILNKKKKFNSIVEANTILKLCMKD